MNLPPKALTEAERIAMAEAATVYWSAMAAIVDGEPQNAAAVPHERASMIAHLCQQGVLGAAMGEVGGMSVGVMLNSCGRVIGQVLSQAPTEEMVARGRAHLEEQIRIGADDFLAISPP